MFHKYFEQNSALCLCRKDNAGINIIGFWKFQSILLTETMLYKWIIPISEEVILELVRRTKCAPILLYGLECFQLGKADRHSLDFTFNRLCMKLFKTVSIDIAKDRQSCSAIDLQSCVLKRRQDKFILRYISTVNGFA